MNKNLRILSLVAGLAIPTTLVFAQNSQQFTTPGVANFTVPAGVLSVRVECVGGGGAGGRVTPSNFLDNDAAGGGGGGAYAMNIVPVMAGQTYPVTVGAGGYNNGTSANGGPSQFADGSFVRAAGGTTRDGNDNTAGVMGGQASASYGKVTYSGGNGGNGNESDADGGGGGGAAGSTGNGYNGGLITAGAARPNYGGNGGIGGANGSNGQPGGSYGGGGGGSSAQGSNDRNGGVGASGIVVINWITVTNVTPINYCIGVSQNMVIKGSNFVGVDSVVINGHQLPFASTTDSIIVADASGLTGSGVLRVYTSNGAFEYPYAINVMDYQVSISVNATTLTANYNGNSTALYQWYDCLNGNTPINGANGSTYTSPTNGLFSVTVFDSGCEFSAPCEAVLSASNEEFANALVRVYPNPSSDYINVVALNATIEKVEILSLSGQVISTHDQAFDQISISNLSKGLYLVRLTTEKGSHIQKVVKD